MSADAESAIRAAYGAGAAAWADGPALVYARLAEVLVERMPLVTTGTGTGARVLDVGSGTGVLSAALTAAGAVPIASDFAWAMLAHDRHRRPPAVTADARRLPVRGGAVDGVGSAFCLNHLDDPIGGLAEMARASRPGGFVVTATYSADNDHPAKAAVDGAAGELGFVAPAWYRSIKVGRETLSNSATKVTALAERAGLVDVAVTEELVDVGIDTTDLLVRWRLGMAALAEFSRQLTEPQRDQLHRRATELVGDDPPPYRPRVVILVGRVR